MTRRWARPREEVAEGCKLQLLFVALPRSPSPHVHTRELSCGGEGRVVKMFAFILQTRENESGHHCGTTLWLQTTPGRSESAEGPASGDRHLVPTGGRGGPPPPPALCRAPGAGGAQAGETTAAPEPGTRPQRPALLDLPSLLKKRQKSGSITPAGRLPCAAYPPRGKAREITGNCTLNFAPGDEPSQTAMRASVPSL